jgi:hypothetical protein
MAYLRAKILFIIAGRKQKEKGSSHLLPRIKLHLIILSCRPE